MTRVKVPMTILGYNKRLVWVRWPGQKNIIFTMPRSFLKRGFSSARVVMVSIDVTSIQHHEDTGWTADMEIVSGIERTPGPGAGLDSEGAG